VAWNVPDARAVGLDEHARRDLHSLQRDGPSSAPAAKRPARRGSDRMARPLLAPTDAVMTASPRTIARTK
jgi:hypothetical protein